MAKFLLDPLLNRLRPICVVLERAWVVFGRAWVVLGRGRNRADSADEESLKPGSTAPITNGKTRVGSEGNPQEKVREEPTTYIMPSSSSIEPSQNLQKGNARDIFIITDDLNEGAPNLLLNCHTRVGRREIYLAAALGIILQIGAMLYFGIITYYTPIKHHFMKDGKDIVRYAFPCAAVGTILLGFGLFICSWVVGESTKETFYEAENHKMFVVWLQKDHTVSDQEFRPYAIYPASKRDYLTISRRNIEYRPKEFRDLCGTILRRLSQGSSVQLFQKLHELSKSSRISSANQSELKAGNTSSGTSLARPNEQPLYWPLKSITVAGSSISLMGFISQFIGMRGLNWTASIVQLGITIVVTILRVIVRRGLGKAPNRTVLKPKFELDWFVLSFGNLLAAPWINLEKPLENTPKKLDDPEPVRSYTWEICTGEEQERLHTESSADSSPDSNLRIKNSLPHQIMLARKYLGHSSHWVSPALEEAISLSRAIEAVASAFLSQQPTETYKWRIPAMCTAYNSTGIAKGDIYITISENTDGTWHVDEAEIEAILSLWLYSTSPAKHSKASRPRSLRVYGSSESEGRLMRDLEWWMRENVPRLYEYTEEDIAQLAKKDSGCTVVGFRTEQDGVKTPTETPAENDQIKYLVLEGQDKQQRLFSRHLLFSFIRSIAKLPEINIASASSTLPLAPHVISKEWKNMKLKDEIISELAKKLEKIGFGSLSDIYIDLIIPLSLEHRLTNVKNIISELANTAHEHERSLQWKKLVDTCISLLTLALQFDLEKESSGPLAIVICLGFLHRLHHEEKLQMSEKRAEEEFTVHLKEFKELFTSEKIQSLPHFLVTVPNELGFSAVSLSILAGPDDGRIVSFPDIEAMNVEAMKESESELKSYFLGIKDFERTDAFGWSALHYAAKLTLDNINIDGKWEPTDDFLNSRDLMGWTFLHHACVFGNKELVSMLLDHGAKIEVAGMDGITPMHCAVRSGKAEILQGLMAELKKRHKRNTRKSEHYVDRNERHPIHWAAVEGKVKMVRLMKDSIRLTDRFGWTPLHLATIYEHENLLQDIIQRHPDTTNIGDSRLRTSLHLAVEYELVNTVQILIEAGAKINTAAEDGSTPLHVAAKQKQTKILEMLLEKGANKEATDREGRTPFYLSVETGEVETIKMLIDAGANVKAAAEDGRTPLHVTLSRGQDGLKVAEMLLEAGADINAKAKDGATALHIAAQSSSLAEILIICAKIIGFKSQHVFIGLQLYKSQESAENIDSSTDSGPRLLDFDAIDEYGQTPLLIAIYKADWLAANFLLDLGAGVNADRRNGYSVVLGAVIGENEDTLLRLLRKGANVNDADGDGYSALHHAVLNGNQRIVQKLLEYKADIDAVVSRSNETPLHIAVRKGQTKLVQTLLEKGADTTLLNSLDLSPLQYALYREDLPMVHTLIEHDKTSTIKAALQPNKEGDTPLHTLAACTSDDEDTICKMLDELLSIGPGIEINAKNKEGRTPLDLALLIQGSKYRMLTTKLLERGAELGSDFTRSFLKEWKEETLEL